MFAALLKRSLPTSITNGALKPDIASLNQKPKISTSPRGHVGMLPKDSVLIKISVPVLLPGSVTSSDSKAKVLLFAMPDLRRRLMNPEKLNLTTARSRRRVLLIFRKHYFK